MAGMKRCVCSATWHCWHSAAMPMICTELFESQYVRAGTQLMQEQACFGQQVAVLGSDGIYTDMPAPLGDIAEAQQM